MDYYKEIRKERIRNIVLTSLILLVAVVSTYTIYHKFRNEDVVSVETNKLDTVFHEKVGENINITKVTPVTDAVGLTSNAYTFTVKNTSEEEATYKIKLVDNEDKIVEDDCKEYIIGKQFIKVSIKEGKKDNKIYTLKDLEDGVLLDTNLKANEEKKYSIRTWVDKDITIPTGSNLHYHSTIKVVEE